MSAVVLLPVYRGRGYAGASVKRTGLYYKVVEHSAQQQDLTGP